MDRVKAGFVIAVNPFNANQQKRIPLVPAVPGNGVAESQDAVDAFIFWTRDPRNILANADELDKRGFHYYVMTTITGYPHELEPSMVSTAKSLTAMRELAQKIGPQRVIWRYDPVFLSNITDENFHRKNFSVLSQALSGSVKRVIISLYSDYQRSHERIKILEQAGVFRMLKPGEARTGQLQPSGHQQSELLTDLAGSAAAAGMEIQSCASHDDFSSCGIKPGACIDSVLINTLWGIELKGRDKNQRPHCLCSKSVDIGSYNSCTAHCVYCYAS